MADKSNKLAKGRRNFLKTMAVGGVAAAAGTIAAPNVSRGQTGPISMRWQSTWPAKDIFHEYAGDFAKKVNDMTGGDLRIEVLPAGAVVPAFGLLDAVSSGTLDGGHGVVVYHYGKSTALALWGSGPAYGMDANMLMSWHKYGGGKELLEKLYKSVNANVVSFPYGPMATQPLGWFKKPITKLEDLQGLKFRTVGISIDLFTAMGMAVNALPGGEIVPAMDRGLLDAAEFNNMTSDRILGFADVSKVCMLQSFHQNSEQFEIMFNKTKFDALPAKMKRDHRERRRSGLAGPELEGDPSLFQRLCRAEDQGQGPVLQDPGCGPAEAARHLRHGCGKEGVGKPAVQGNRRVAEEVRGPCGSLGHGQQRQPPHGLQPLLREARRRTGPRHRRRVSQQPRETPCPNRAWCLFFCSGCPFMPVTDS